MDSLGHSFTERGKAMARQVTATAKAALTHSDEYGWQIEFRPILPISGVMVAQHLGHCSTQEAFLAFDTFVGPSREPSTGPVC